jgi:hypothetical protein
MMPEAAVAFATFVIVLLALNRWTREEPGLVFEDDDAEAAKLFIKAKIEEHVGSLAESYLEAGGGSGSGDDDVPGGFAQHIEHFIAAFLTHESADRSGLGAAVRRVVTLEREHVYALVLARVQDHLRNDRAGGHPGE